jgi:hypothetical protein
MGPHGDGEGGVEHALLGAPLGRLAQGLAGRWRAGLRARGARRQADGEHREGAHAVPAGGAGPSDSDMCMIICEPSLRRGRRSWAFS